MTWNQFKQHIDMLLAKEGISQDEDIWYIDISYPEVVEIGKEDSNSNCPSVSFDESSGIMIS
jgi:hypothetical protein